MLAGASDGRGVAASTPPPVIARVSMVQGATTAAASATAMGVQETPAGRDGD